MPEANSARIARTDAGSSSRSEPSDRPTEANAVAVLAEGARVSENIDPARRAAHGAGRISARRAHGRDDRIARGVIVGARKASGAFETPADAGGSLSGVSDDQPRRIIPPGWFQAASGLWLPSNLRDWDRRVSLEIGRDSTGRQIVAVLHQLPDSTTQVHAFVDERAIGLPTSTSPTQINRAARVAFESAAFYISGVAMATYDARPDPDQQRELARTLIVDPDIAEGIDRALCLGQGTVVFAEQHLAALGRLAVKHSDRWRAADLDHEVRTLERALLGCSALAMSDSERLTGNHADRFDAVSFLVHNGAYYSREPLFEALARNSWLYQDLAQSEDARAHPDWRDLEHWAVEASGLRLRDQFAVGMAALAVSRVLDDEGRLVGRGLLAATWASDVAQRLEVATDHVVEVISADQAWYAEQFDEIERRYGLSDAAAAAGWTTSPFEKRPLMRLRDGRMLLWSARAMTSWLTDGFYYRALTHAAERNDIPAFTRLNGWLVERYAQEVVEAALPPTKPAGSGRALRSITYDAPSGEIDSPDIALDYGEDLVLVEVRSGRLKLDTRLTGDPARVEDDLRVLIVNKAQQLSRRIDDYLGGRFELDGIDRRHVTRIWPVVLSGASLLMAEMLHEWIVEEIGDHLRQPTVQPLTILDMTDWEQLCGLLETGQSAPDLLERKTGAYRGLDWRRMVHDDPFLPSDARASAVVEKGDASFRRMIEDFGWDPTRLER